MSRRGKSTGRQGQYLIQNQLSLRHVRAIIARNITAPDQTELPNLYYEIVQSSSSTTDNSASSSQGGQRQRRMRGRETLVYESEMAEHSQNPVWLPIDALQDDKFKLLSTFVVRVIAMGRRRAFRKVEANSRSAKMARREAAPTRSGKHKQNTKKKNEKRPSNRE